MIEYIIGIGEILDSHEQDISLLEKILFGEHLDEIKELSKEYAKLSRFSDDDDFASQRKVEILGKIKNLTAKTSLTSYDNYEVIDYGNVKEIIGTREITTSTASGSSYSEGWATLDFSEVNAERVISIQVTGMDVAGLAEREGATYAKLTNTSVSLGAFSNTPNTVTVSFSIKFV